MGPKATFFWWPLIGAIRLVSPLNGYLRAGVALFVEPERQLFRQPS